MATPNTSSHQKQLEFDDNKFLASLFGYHDKNLKVLEDKFKVKLYTREISSQLKEVEILLKKLIMLFKDYM